MRFLLNDDPGAGGGGGGTETVEDLKAKLAAAEAKATDAEAKLTKESEEKKEIIRKRDELKGKLKAIEDAKTIESGEFKPLYEQEKTKREALEADAADAKAKLEAIETAVKEDLFAQLPEEHKGIAKLIPTIEGLREYVKVNALKPAPGQDPGKPGTGAVDYKDKKWDDLDYNEKMKLEKDNPDVYKKLYKDKYGTNP